MDILVGGLVIGALCLCAYLAPQFWRLSWNRRTRILCRKQHSLVLTFDDGPGVALTPRLLDLLDSHGARATFYCLGRRAEANPKIVQLIAQRGHELATHSQDHYHAWKAMPWTIAQDIARGFRSIAMIRGAENNSELRFRPTYGKLTLAGVLVARRLRFPIDWWTIDSGDTYEILPDPSGVLADLERQGGGVVLLHDFDRDEAIASERAAYVLEMTDRICRRSHELGLTLVTMSELMDALHP